MHLFVDFSIVIKKALLRKLNFSRAQLEWYNTNKDKEGLCHETLEDRAFLQNDDSPAASNALNKNGFQVTKLATTGGFLRAGNTTLIVGCEDEKVQDAINIIGEYSSKRTEIVPSTASYDIGRYASFPVEVQVGGATIFVLNVEQFVKL